MPNKLLQQSPAAPVIQEALRQGLSRRDFLRNLFLTAGAVGAAQWLTACGAGVSSAVSANSTDFANLGPLGAPDANGVRTPPGFSTRVVAINTELPFSQGMNATFGGNGRPVGGRFWHIFNDGGGVVPRANGGWIYVSNSEVPGLENSVAVDRNLEDAVATFLSIEQLLLNGILPLPLTTGLGGAGVLVFDPDGSIVDSYSILSGTTFNCAGSITPWGTWFSCEETLDGFVFECDPFAPNSQGVPRPALGRFEHEATFVDTHNRVIYETEDHPQGRFYRFVPDASDWPQGASRPALNSGRLQAMVVEGEGVDAALNGPQPVRWKDVLNPGQRQFENRDPETTAFKGGEGVWIFENVAYFSTKKDNRIWAYDTIAQTIEVIYDLATAEPPNNFLSGVDNITVTDRGDVLVAEDGGDMMVVAILPDRSLRPLLQIVNQDASEIAGIAFNPAGDRMYFTSDRGGRNGLGGYGLGAGMLYELIFPATA